MLRLPRQKEPRDAHRIQTGKLPCYPEPSCVFFDKAHIKPGIVGSQHGIPAKIQKFRQHLLNGFRIHHHAVIDTCKLLYPEGYGTIRIHKT